MNITYIILLVGLLICSVVDIRKHMISVPFVIMWTILLGGMQIYQDTISIGLILGTVLTVLVSSVVSWLSGGQIGMGDGFLFGMTAMGLGIMCNIYMLAYCFMGAFLMAVILFVICRKGKDTRMPLAPFVLCGSLLVMILGGK
ncbi:MAG: hypothetical protein Q4D32_01285 [Eubacteriales bacterium]|nr:hypothetical protein [Eubacteriales bacterium]